MSLSIFNFLFTESSQLYIETNYYYSQTFDWNRRHWASIQWYLHLNGFTNLTYTKHITSRKTGILSIRRKHLSKEPRTQSVRKCTNRKIFVGKAKIEK